MKSACLRLAAWCGRMPVAPLHAVCYHTARTDAYLRMEYNDPGRGLRSLASDLPTDEDKLDFEPYARTLAEIAADDSTSTPLTIGLYGPWGSGKTSLMKMIRRYLKEDKPGMHYPVVWFDAWKYDREDALWRALVLRVLHTVRTQKEVMEDEDLQNRFDDLEASLYKVVEREELGEVRIEWDDMIKGAGKSLLHLGLHMIPAVGQVLPKLLEKGQQEAASSDVNLLFDAIKRERHKVYREHIQSLEQFQEAFEDVIEKTVTQKGQRLVVFVDDLDRCLPTKAVQVLESIKLFMDVPGCLFILGLDQQVISRGIEIKYREFGLDKLESKEQRRQFIIEGTRYLEKIIQVPFQIPPLAGHVQADFVRSLIDNEGCADVFAQGMGGSPRQVKRTVNTFQLLWRLAEKRKESKHPEQQYILPIRLAKVVAIQQLSPPLYERLRETPRYLRELEIYFRADSGSDRPQLASEDAESTSTNPEQPQIAPALRDLVGQLALGRLMRVRLDEAEASFKDLSIEELTAYFTLTRSTEAPEVVAEAASDPRVFSYEPETVPVAAGPFLMGTTKKQFMELGLPDSWKRETPQHEVYLSDYGIGKYPVTNVEYQAFVEEEAHTPPRGWEGEAFPEGRGDHPVTDVSWSDAKTYCEWLSKRTGKTYDLPTEAQWEKASRGIDGRTYPWGNEWDQNKLNSREGGKGETTPVGDYSPEGDSPYGASDMVGNVWEWCRDWNAEETYKLRAGDEVQDPLGPEEGGAKILRGGSFDNSNDNGRCAYRGLDYPGVHYNLRGFRVVLLPSPLKSEHSER